MLICKVHYNSIKNLRLSKWIAISNSIIVIKNDELSSICFDLFAVKIMSKVYRQFAHRQILCFIWIFMRSSWKWLGICYYIRLFHTFDQYVHRMKWMEKRCFVRFLIQNQPEWLRCNELREANSVDLLIFKLTFRLILLKKIVYNLKSYNLFLILVGVCKSISLLKISLI